MTDPAEVGKAGKKVIEESGSENGGSSKMEKAKKAKNAVSKIPKQLKNDKGGKPLEDIQEQYGCSKGSALCVRGAQKAFGVEEFPAIADLAIGAGFTILALRSGD